MAAVVATFACGVFFGAALYISLAQQPGALEAGPDVAVRLFGPMYRRAAVMQVVSAVTGTAAAVIAWLVGDDLWWLVGGILLVSVVPLTLLWIKPINDQLLYPGRAPDQPGTEGLLRAWGSRHAVRVAVSGMAFLVFLWRLGLG